jgi:hypothetical protein
MAGTTERLKPKLLDGKPHRFGCVGLLHSHPSETKQQAILMLVLSKPGECFDFGEFVSERHL